MLGDKTFGLLWAKQVIFDRLGQFEKIRATLGYFRPKIQCPNIALKIRLTTFSGHPAGTNTKADKLKPNVVAMTPMNTLAPTAFSMWGSFMKGAPPF